MAKQISRIFLDLLNRGTRNTGDRTRIGHRYQSLIEAKMKTRTVTRFARFVVHQDEDCKGKVIARPLSSVIAIVNRTPTSLLTQPKKWKNLHM